MSWPSTAQRTREVGIRVALGARRSEVVRQMMGRGTAPALLGIVLGIAISAGLSRFLESYLHEMEPDESWAYMAVLVLGVCLVLIASWLPARKAARIDPTIALRYE